MLILKISTGLSHIPLKVFIWLLGKSHLKKNTSFIICGTAGMKEQLHQHIASMYIHNGC